MAGWAGVMAFLSLARGQWVGSRLGFLVRLAETLGLDPETVWTTLHFLGFFALGLVVAYALSRGLQREPSFRAWSAWVVAIVAYGIALELLQVFAPQRHVSPGDLLANLVGGGVGLLLGRGAQRLVARNTRSPVRR